MEFVFIFLTNFPGRRLYDFLFLGACGAFFFSLAPPAPFNRAGVLLKQIKKMKRTDRKMKGNEKEMERNKRKKKEMEKK